MINMILVCAITAFVLTLIKESWHDQLAKDIKCKLSRCPSCGYYAFNGIECFDCGYHR